MFISKNGATFQNSGIQLIREQLGAIEPLGDTISLAVILYPPDKRIRDLDNYLKPLLDTITKSGVWLDDSLVDQLSVYRGAVTPAGRCFVRIKVAGPILQNTPEHRALI